MAVGDAHVFPGSLTPVLTQLFFPKPPTTFLTCFCRGDRRKYVRKKVRLKQGSNSKPPDRESDTLTTEQPGRGGYFQNKKKKKLYTTHIFRTRMHFLRVNVTYSDAVTMIHDVIRTDNPFP